MTSFERYAEYYDLIYQDKNYHGECDFIEDIFRRFSPHPVKTILSAGCGTGGHDILLAKRGYHITGIDSSETMLARAKGKAVKDNLSIDFQLGDLRQIELDKKFDACICMFAVMDYIVKTEDILQTLRNIRRHLNNGSLFVFDFWNGLAVLRTLPSVRVKVAQNEELRIIRTAEPELDAFNHLCYVHYRLLVFQNNTLLDEFEETHIIRYFFPQEKIHYLHDSGFEVVKVCPFLDLAGKVDETVWNVAAIARAV